MVRIQAATPARRKSKTVAYAIAAALLLALTVSPAAGANGGTNFVVVPTVKKVTCVKSCQGKGANKRIRGGSTIRIQGLNLDATSRIVFAGARGTADDTAALPISAKSSKLTVRVPADTATGPLLAETKTGARSRPTKTLLVLPQPPVIGSPDLKPVPTDVPGAKLEAGTSTPRTVFQGSKQLVKFSVRVSGIDDARVAVSLLRKSNGAVLGSWTLAAPAGTTVSVDWDGQSAGAAAPSGRYAFAAQIIPPGVSPASVGSLAGTNDARDAFDLYGFRFPIRGKHTYGGGLGDGRGHQGIDIMARCGTKLVAARGGTVVESRFQGAAGNFIAIRPDDKSIGDQAYLHLQKRSPFRKGDRVYTGQQIGVVGTTGRSTACHLHFEQWTGAIWRSKPVNVMSDLKAWDAVS